MRGGTSKSIVFSANDLPQESARRNDVILAAFGSPDARQIDGLGGADPLTSKLAIVAESERDGADIDYTFGQVGIAVPTINFGVSCGNTAAAVAVYAIQQGYVDADEGTTRVRIFDTNSGKRIVAEVPTENGHVVTDGDYKICGVPGSAPEVRLDFVDPAGGVTGKLLPTALPLDTINVGADRDFKFSLVDCGNLYAIFPASAFQLSGTEWPEVLDTARDMSLLVEQLRNAIAEEYLANYLPDFSQERRAAKLKVAIAGPAISHDQADGTRIDPGCIDFVARIINQERVHKAFAVTGAICFAAASSIPGTCVHALYSEGGGPTERMRLGHPQGIIETRISASSENRKTVVKSVQVSRTARRIMDGRVYVRG